MMTYFKSASVIGGCVGTPRVGVASEATACGDRMLPGCGAHRECIINELLVNKGRSTAPLLLM